MPERCELHQVFMVLGKCGLAEPKAEGASSLVIYLHRGAEHCAFDAHARSIEVFATYLNGSK